MSGAPVLIRLRWEDPATGQSHNSVLQAPVAIGREADHMPNQLGNQSITPLELDHKQVSRYHALITAVNQQLQLTDKSANGTFLNGRPIRQDGQAFTAKDTLRIGPFKITVEIMRDRGTNATELNLDRSYLSKSKAKGTPNALLIWCMGGAALLLLGWGIWAIAQLLIENARPTIESGSAESGLNRSVESHQT